MNIKQELARSLSDTDIKRFLKNKTKIIQYKELSKYNNIDDLLYPYGHVILLYMTGHNYGHWTLIMRRGQNEIHFFDSYGYKPDEEFNFIDNEFRAVSNQIYKKIVFMLLNSPYNITYNEYKLQSKSTKKQQISTCGRWCLGRLINGHLDERQFAGFFKGKNKDIKITKYIRI
jgi:hypothetical protein